MVFEERADFSLGESEKSDPQTKQREASWLTRVPQVGHNFVGLLSSGLIDILT
jgi:hypothetical protein